MASPSNTLRAALALNAIVFLAGCSSSASSPEQAVRAFHAALASGDYAAAWSHVSEAQRSRLATDLKSAASSNAASQDAFAARLSAQFGTPFSVAELGSLTPQAFFEKAMRSAVERDGGKLRALISAAEIKPGGVAPSGDRADVAISFRAPALANSGKSSDLVAVDQRIVHCVRENGGWRLLYTP